MTAAPSSESATLASFFAENLVGVGESLEELLGSIASNRLEARRRVTQTFGLDPTAEVLHSIVKIACDEACDGTRYELPRRLLCLRILVDQELKQLLESRGPDAETIRHCNDSLEILLRALHRMEDEFCTILDQPELDHRDRDYLLQVCDSLTPNREELVAALLLAPRLEILVSAVADGNLQNAVPSLSDDDAEMIRRGLIDDPSDDAAPSRVCVNAVALRSLIDEDLTSWDEIVAARHAEQDEADIVHRVGTFERLKLDKLSYGVLIEQLQKQQDLALQASLERFAEQVSRVRGDLFSSYIRLAPILRGESPTGAGSEEPDEQTRQLLEACTEAEAAAERMAASESSTDEIYMNALTGMRKSGKKVEEVGPGIVDLRRERKRIAILASVAAAVLIACVTFLSTYPRPEPPIRVSTLEFSHLAPLTEVQPVGEMLYARVPNYYWDGLTDGERTHCIGEIGRQAVKSGFAVVYLVDGGGEPVASWTAERGVELATREN